MGRHLLSINGVKRHLSRKDKMQRTLILHRESTELNNSKTMLKHSQKFYENVVLSRLKPSKKNTCHLSQPTHLGNLA